MDTIRDIELEKKIVVEFFAPNRVERGLYLLNNQKKANQLFNNMEEKFLNPKKMFKMEKDFFNNADFYEAIMVKKCRYPYFFSYSLKRYMEWQELYKIDLLTFQEVIIYLENGIGVFQAHEKCSTREMFLLK